MDSCFSRMKIHGAKSTVTFPFRPIGRFRIERLPTYFLDHGLYPNPIATLLISPLPVLLSFSSFIHIFTSKHFALDGAVI